MAFMIESQDWVGEEDPNKWENCLITPCDTIDEVLEHLATLVKWDLSVNVSYPYRIVKV